MHSKIIYIAVLIAISTLASCSNNTVIDENYDFESGIWHEDSLAQFSFNIEDTIATYNISYNVRHAVSYPYYNLYLTYFLEDSTDVINSEMQEIILFNKKTGEPRGEGVGDLFDRSAVIFENYSFDKPGTYTFKTKQYMRSIELNEIFSFGLLIEKNEDN
ncbi:MAG: gliding motility lipoprotein GldH [Reichenbachiella sp.]